MAANGIFSHLLTKKHHLIFPSHKSGEGGHMEIKTLDEIKASCEDCQKCELYKTRTNVVFGTGNPKASLMFIGEAPGQHEDETGIPFVGAAGKLLDKYLDAVGIDRGDVYIANILKCRPPKNRDSPSGGGGLLHRLSARAGGRHRAEGHRLSRTDLRHAHHQTGFQNHGGARQMVREKGLFGLCGLSSRGAAARSAQKGRHARRYDGN